MDTKLIFFVDDDKLILNLMDYSFNNREGCHVQCFKSGEECLNHLHLNPDLVVLDYYFEDESSVGLTGREILKKIVEIDPNIPVIMFSGQTSDVVISELLELGAWKYIKKDSFFIDTLMESIKEISAG